MEKEQKIILLRIIITIAALIALYFMPITGIWLLLCYFAVYLLIGYDIIAEAIEGIGHGEVLDENFLMTVASLGAFALAIYEKSNDFREAVAVLLFYQIGEFFEDYAVDKSRDDIAALMDIRPDYANVEKDGALVKVSPDTVSVGDVITVLPGEKIPLDGVITEGSSDLNMAALSGESAPVEVGVGSEVVSGGINMSGVLQVRVNKPFGESTVQKILDLLENAAERKSHSEEFITKFAHYYTPAVCLLALLLAICPPLVNLLIMGNPASWGVWIHRALIFLVISCPCALVVSIPLCFYVGIGNASARGILIKGSNYMETLSKLQTVVFDKTGTLTKGVFEVSDVHHNEMERRELLEYAAYAENSSTHPIAQSIVKAYKEDWFDCKGGVDCGDAVAMDCAGTGDKACVGTGDKACAGTGDKACVGIGDKACVGNVSIDRSRIGSIEEVPGMGVCAQIDGKEVCVGNDKLMEKKGVSYIPCHDEGTILHVAVDGAYAGHIVIADTLKDTSEEAVLQLKRNGVKKICMLTGDREEIARNIAHRIGIDDVWGSLLPSQKVEKVEEMLSDSGNSPLAFVGDGINDAPVLMRADLGIAMGALGSDAAIEAADIVLMDDDPIKISTAMKLAGRCMRTVYVNIVLCLGIKLICLLLGALGVAGMQMAVFADVGVLILAILNSIVSQRIGK